MNYVFPNAEQGQQGNPPRRPSPQGERDTVKERLNGVQEWRAAAGEEHRAGIDADRSSAHEDAKWWNDIMGFQHKKENPVEQERNKNRIEQEAKHPKHVQQDGGRSRRICGGG